MRFLFRSSASEAEVPSRAVNRRRAPVASEASAPRRGLFSVLRRRPQPEAAQAGDVLTDVDEGVLVKDLPVPEVKGAADALLTGTVIALVAFGVVMVYSASNVFAHSRYGDPQHFLIRQAVFAIAGLVTMVALARVDYHYLRVATKPFMAFSFLLMMVTVLGLGRSAGGASRWIALGPVNVQPAEIAKVAMIGWLAYSLSNKVTRVHTFWIGMVPHLMVAGLYGLMCYLQPDLGSAVMIGLITFVLLFTAGARVSYIVAMSMPTLLVVAAAIYTSPYRMRRIRAFLDPFERRFDESYQIAESLMSFGAGGMHGVGLGDSRQKLFFLPEAHTDFISAIIGEELGFIGVVGLAALFVVVVYRGLRAAYYAADDYGTYLAVGISMFIGLQAFINLAVATSLLPTKGLVLPFISYGGSALLVNCAAVGVLLNVSRPRKAVSGKGVQWSVPGQVARAGGVS